MSITFRNDYKEELVNHLSSAVKQVQIEFTSAASDGEFKPSVKNDSHAGNILFSCLELILTHGLKSHGLGIWQAVQYFCRNDVKRTINNLRNVRTSKGRSRAWIYLALNERELESYFHTFQANLQHFHKFYARSALICSNQVSLLQTLIAGLDSVTFNLKLDVSYLDFSIICTKDWKENQSCSSQTNNVNTANGKGSTVHLDTQSLLEARHKAVGFFKGLLSQESLPSTKSMQNIDSNTLVAVNSNQGHMSGKKYCPDCGSQNELICLCVKRKQEPIPAAAPSKHTEILKSFLQGNESNNDAWSISDAKRINPFDKDCVDKEEIEMTQVRRFDMHVAVIDTPIEVTRKPRKRRKKISETSSVCSAMSDELNSISKFIEAKKRSSHGDICLSNPLIGFDPGNDDISQSGSEFSLLNVDGSQEGSIVFIEPEAENILQKPTDSKSDIELTPENINNLSTECVMSCQDHSIDNLSIEISCRTEESVETSAPISASFNMDLRNDRMTDSDTVVGSTLEENDVRLQVEESSKDNSEKLASADQPDVTTSEDAMTQNIADMIGERREIHHSRKSSIDSEIESQLSTPGSSYDHHKMSSQSTPIKKNRNDLDLYGQSDSDEKFSVTSELDNDGRKNEMREKAMDVRLMSPEEKRSLRKNKSAMRYRSQSEKILEDLTKLEVERLRAEIEAKLKPTRDKLARVQKSILERTSSTEIVPANFENLDSPKTPIISNASHDDTSLASDDASKNDFASNSSISNPRMTDNLQADVTPNLQTVASIDNTLKLYLMLEILVDENEKIIKMFHVGTGHSEGNWTPLYLLFTDSYVYFLRSGDGNAPYQPEHIVSYEDMDYASIGSYDQTIEFVFYKTTKLAKSRKHPPARCRAKIMVDSCDKALTDLLVSTLSNAVAIYTRRHDAIKVCPPVFRDAREHQVSLVKYLRSEGLTGDIQYYQLVHWEDPDFVKGANVAKVTMQGTLKYKVHSFWGSTTKPAYFILNGGVLYQYAKRENKKPDGSYELTGGKCVGCRRIKSSESSKPSGLDFIIDFQDGCTLELSGFSVMEVTEWLQCLCMIVSLDQSSRIDQQACTDGIVLNMLNHDALVPCSLIISDETLLLCHEDHHTGFCRTLAKAKREDIYTVNIDRTRSVMCELVVVKNSNMPQNAKWGIFFPRQDPLQKFLNVVDAFSKAPLLCDKSDDADITHYLEARALLDSRWTRTDNLLKGRSAGSESYAFL